MQPKFGLLASTCGLAAVLAARSLAQPAARAPGAVEEAVVTAQKREERLQDVPISISVVSPAVMTAVNAKNLNELSGAVPGVQFNGNGGGGRTISACAPPVRP